MKNDEIRAFRIELAPEVLSDLRQRLKNTRWSYQREGANWDAGTDLNYLKELVDYWQNTYDWRKQEAALNQFAHFKTEVDGIGIHGEECGGVGGSSIVVGDYKAAKTCISGSGGG